MTFTVHDEVEILALLAHNPRVGHGDKIIVRQGSDITSRWKVRQRWGKGELVIWKDRAKRITPAVQAS